MLADQTVFPVCIDEPSSRSGGSAYVADLAAEGAALGPRVFERAICTIARECADASLERIEIPDFRTALATDADGVRYHIELCYGDQILDTELLCTLSELRRPEAYRFVLVTAGGVTNVAADRFRDYDATLLRIDADRETKTAIWRPR